MLVVFQKAGGGCEFTLLYALLDLNLPLPFIKVYTDSCFCRVSFCIFEEGHPGELHESSLSQFDHNLLLEAEKLIKRYNIAR